MPRWYRRRSRYIRGHHRHRADHLGETGRLGKACRNRCTPRKSRIRQSPHDRHFLREIPHRLDIPQSFLCRIQQHHRVHRPHGTPYLRLRRHPQGSRQRAHRIFLSGHNRHPCHDRSSPLKPEGHSDKRPTFHHTFPLHHIRLGSPGRPYRPAQRCLAGSRRRYRCIAQRDRIRQ